MDIDLSRFRQTFFDETWEHIARLEAGVLELENRPGQELLDSIFRCAHSIKGASGTLGFDEIAAFTHRLETLLDQVRAGETAPTPAIASLLLRATDTLKSLLERAQSGASEGGAGTEEMEAELLAACRSAPPSEAPLPEPEGVGRERVSTIRFAPSPEIFRLGMDPLLVLRDLARLGEVVNVRPDDSRLPPLAEMEPDTSYLAWTVELKTSHSEAEIRDVFAFVEDVAEIEIAGAEPGQAPAPLPVQAVQAARASRPPAHDLSLRVATAKVDKLIDLVGELVIAQSMAGQILSGFSMEKLGRLEEAMADVDRYTRELQERVMGIRMVPVETLFSRFPRVVRDMAASLGKKLHLEIGGADTELDKSVVERLTDPLTHLIRNAADHGIESVEDRLAAGKPEQGLIRLEAYHQSGNVMIEVSDDGRGLDAGRIRKKAVASGLIAADEELTEEQTHALIFRAGFSTSEQVTGLSGRGVGMDVVKRNVEALNGSVAIVSRPGEGTTFRIKLPLTLAILDGLAMKVGEQTYIVPLLAISESIRPRPDQVRSMAGRGEVVVLRGEPVPLVRLHRLFGVRTEITDPSRSLVVVVEHIGSRLALLVNELLGQQQVVIKSLEAHYRKVEGVMGATILGDGKAALILDIAGIAEMARTAAATAA